MNSQNTIRNDATITNNENIQSCETPKINKNYNIPTISIPNHHSKHIASTSSSKLSFNKPTILPPVGKQYMCFMKEGKSYQVPRCIISRIMNKAIDYVLSIDTFEQQCVVLKDMLKSPRLKYHVHTIGIEPSLINNTIYEQNVLKTSKDYTNKLVSVIPSNNSKTFLRLIWFLLLKDSPPTVLYLPGHQH